jgi:integrase
MNTEVLGTGVVLLLLVVAGIVVLLAVHDGDTGRSANEGNPLRRAMHELGIYSGLRPGTLVSLQRAWLRLDDRAISIPKMKRGHPFDLPLSTHMLDLVRRALELSQMLYPGAPWLFPTRSAADRTVICTQVWR